MSADNDNEAAKQSQPQTKRCSKCLTSKPTTEFYKKKSGRFGVAGCCIECDKIKKAENYKKNAPRNREIAREYRLKNPEKVKASNAKWYAEHPNYAKERYAKNPSAIKAANKRWQQANPEKAREAAKNWIINNPEKAKAKAKRAMAKYRTTPKGMLEMSISDGVRRGIKSGSKNSRKTFDILGYTANELKVHLEKQFLPGMSWENYGRGGWEIDHIIPLAAHNYETPDDLDFKKAWALSNLQPLWGTDNRRKHAKLTKPFQPSLMLQIANDNNRQTSGEVKK